MYRRQGRGRLLRAAAATMLCPPTAQYSSPRPTRSKNAVLTWANDNGITAYNEASHTGLLRHIVVRQSSDGQVMAGIVLRKDTDTSALADALTGIDGLCSIIVNINGRRSNRDSR